MPQPNDCSLLEIYKLHSELADRVSQRRQAANRQYISLHVGLFVLVAATLRFGFGDVPVPAVLVALSVFGVALSAAWAVEIRSYRQLNREKFSVLHHLESSLPFQFFKLEWDRSLRSREIDDANAPAHKDNDYWRLTHVENGLPIIFILLYFSAAFYSLCIQ